MPRGSDVVALEKVAKRKDQLRRLLEQVEDCRAKGRAELLAASEAGVSKTKLALTWGTSYGHLKNMIVQAEQERG